MGQLWRSVSCCVTCCYNCVDRISCHALLFVRSFKCLYECRYSRAESIVEIDCQLSCWHPLGSESAVTNYICAIADLGLC